MCLSGLNLLLQGSRATRYLLYFNMWIKLKCVEFDKNVQVESYDVNTFHGDPGLGCLCGNGEHKLVDLA